MRVYVDSSVVLRVALGEPDRLIEWTRFSDPISSELIRIECLRTIDRARLQGRSDERELARVRGDLLHIIDAFTLIELDDRIKTRAADPFPTVVGTLDALHLASALAMRATSDDLMLATHDRALATAAEALGFEVLN
jgi:predicted nucleic acid-binding protein